MVSIKQIYLANYKVNRNATTEAFVIGINDENPRFKPVFGFNEGTTGWLYLRFAEAGGHQAPWAHVQVPLLPALVVRIQRRDPPVQGADDHEWPTDTTCRRQNKV